MIIVLTGGIAAGKSTIAALFEKAGADIIDTDQIAREVVEPGSHLLADIETHFGADILNDKGELNRSLLKDKIFESEADRLWLEELLHPAIRIRAYDEVRKSKAPIQVIMVPLLRDKKDYPATKIISVECDPEIQLKRVMTRDKISKELAIKIIASQPSPKDREKIADMVFYNNGSLEDLQKEFKFN